MRPVKLCNLTNMAKVVARPFIQKLPYSDPTRFFVLTSSSDGAGWKITQPGKGPITFVAKLL